LVPATGQLIGNDEVTFEKLNQAVNSCQDLVRNLSSNTLRGTKKAIVPVLVVPEGLLWQVDYDEDGAMTTPPRQVSRAALFLDIAWTAPLSQGDILSYRLSHIELVSLDALAGAAEFWLGPNGFFPK
jgi:hypothetical protein